jgi:uncharacterized Zn finger protein
VPHKAITEELRRAITTRNLRSMAGNVYFGRGEGYFEGGQVKGLQERAGVIQATVRGTHPYKVRLQVKSGRFNTFCSCPLGEGGEFCKHIVATGLEWIAQQEKPGKSQKGKKQRDVTSKEIEKWLRAQSPEDLAGIIMEHAGEDDHLYNGLKMRVAAGSGAINVTALRSVIRAAIETEDFDSRRDDYEYSQGVDRIVRQLRDLLKEGHASQVMELAEYAIELCEGQMLEMSYVDSTVSMAMNDLIDLHLMACRRAKPDPRELAAKLLERELNEQWEYWRGSCERYGRVLGKEGRKAFRELAAAAWEKLPAVAPGEKNPLRYGYRMTLTEMMKSFAEEDGDFGRLLEVMSKDLSTSDDFFWIAERCRKERKYGLAREWAEKGLREFAEDPETRLRRFLAEEYARAKRGEEAIDLIWSNFTVHPELETYQELLKYAGKIKQKPVWREKALALIRDPLAGKQARGGGKRLPRVWGVVDRSVLVEIFLWEKNVDEAWREAEAGGCSDSLWLELAKQREKEHPADAVPVYQGLAEQEIERKNNQAYMEAISLIGHVRKLFLAMGREEDFQGYLTEVKVRHRAKRNLMKYLAETPWGR